MVSPLYAGWFKQLWKLKGLVLTSNELVASFLSEMPEPRSVIHSMKRKTISYSFHYDICYHAKK